MSLPTPAVRAALVVLVTSALVAAAGGWLHVEAVRATGRDEARRALDARVALVAATLEPAAVDRNALLVAFVPYTRATVMTPGSALALVDAEGRLVATTSAEMTRGVPWNVAIERTARGHAMPSVLVGGEPHWVASRSLGPSGYSVAALRPAYRLPARVLATTLTMIASLWGLLAAVVLGGTYLAGPHATERLRLLGERVAHPDADPEALVDRSRRSLGALAEAFAPVARRLRQLGGAVAGAREHVGALYQVNPHYLLLCTMDGRVVEANPAFYAITGLSPETLRGGRIEALAEMFPVEPLMELAERSLREGASIGGIEYAIQDRDDSGRPVEVALRAFHQGDTTLVLFQATDVTVRRTLERKVATFSDTLDLMVDQRVQQLAAGQVSLRRILDAAGVAVASFDRGGATRRWSGAAQALSGRVAADVPHFTAAAAALGLGETDRAAFGHWFWSPDRVAFVAVHRGADGRPRPMVWHKVDAERAGSADHRTIVGMETPDDGLVARLAADALHGATGDGAAGDGGTSLPHSAPAAERAR